MILTTPARVARTLEFLFKRSDASGDVYPDDAASGVLPGPDPDRVIFLGEMGQLNLGVRTHELSLPAFFARHHAGVTGRGVVWSMHGFTRARLDDAVDVVGALECDLRNADAVVLLVGITDTLRVMRAKVWQLQMHTALTGLVARITPDARILISEIPPLDNAGSLSKGARLAAGVHGKALNQHTRLAAAAFPQATVVPFPEELTKSLWKPESEEARYTSTYRTWGRHLADALPVRPRI